MVHREIASDFLILNNEIKLSVVICRCKTYSAHKKSWKLKFDAGLMPDLTIAVRMDGTNREILDYYVIPALDVENPKIRLAENNHFSLDAYRFEDLDSFYLLTRRMKVMEAA